MEAGKPWDPKKKSFTAKNLSLLIILPTAGGNYLYLTSSRLPSRTSHVSHVVKSFTWELENLPEAAEKN